MYARSPAQGRIRSSTPMLCQQRSPTPASATGICPSLAVCVTGQRELCRRPMRYGEWRPSAIMPITLPLTRSERDWTNYERSPVINAAPSCVLKRCGGAATAASSPTTCWRKGFRWRISWDTTRSTARSSRLACDCYPTGRSYIQPRRRRSMQSADSTPAHVDCTCVYTESLCDGIKTRSASECLRVRGDFVRHQEAAMSEQENKLDGPDFAQGVQLADLVEGSMILGHVAGESVVLARAGGALFAIGAECTHYHGPLAEGMLVADTVRCPWHHACFSLGTGEALGAPALNPVACWRVEQRDDRIFVEHKQELLEPHRAAGAAPAGSPAKIVIVGGGAAGFAAAEKLRRERYEGDLVMVSGEEVPPVDRPNLSKDYLAGKAPEEWIPLRPASFYSENGIDLRLGTNATGIDVRAREVVF